MKTFMSIGLAAAIVGALVVSNASAQRDAGAKARGEYGRGFWNSRAQQFVYCPPRYVVVRQPQQAAAPEVAARDESQDESTRRFSYEPSVDTEQQPVIIEQRPMQTYQRRSIQPRSTTKALTPPEVRLRPGSRKW